MPRTMSSTCKCSPALPVCGRYRGETTQPTKSESRSTSITCRIGRCGSTFISWHARPRLCCCAKERIDVMPTVHQSLHRQAAWVVVGRIIGIGATLAANVVAARLLGPAQFGTYLLVTTIIALGSLLGMAGLNEAALRFISESLALERFGLERGYIHHTLTIAAIASVTSAATIAGGLTLIGLLSGNNLRLGLILAVLLGVAVLAWQQLGAELLRAYGNLRLASFFSGGQAGGPISNLLFLMGLAAVAIFAVQIDATGAVVMAVASLCITCPLVYVGLWCTSRMQRGIAGGASPLSAVQQRELLAVGGMLLVNQLLAFATQQFD